MMRPDLAQALFEKPSLDRLRMVDGFTSFVAYVFARAGYSVQPAPAGSPATFQLLSDDPQDGRALAFVTVKSVARNYVGNATVLQLQDRIGQSGIKGYIVTNSDFTKDARKQASASPQIYLLDCKLLERYIEYIRGSRDAHAKTPPIPPDAFVESGAVPRCDRSRTRILAIANNKGGEGKTTTALYLAKRLGEQNKRVLLVDVDAQANLSQTVLARGASGGYQASLVEYFQGHADLAQLVQPTHLQNVWLIPSHVRLRLVITGAATDPSVELHFLQSLHSQAIHPPRSPEEDTAFDWIIVDTPPDVLFLTRCALAASHYVVAPTSPGPYAESGLQQLFDTMGAMRGLTGGDIRLMGCLITKWQDSAQNRQSVENLRQVNLAPKGIQIFETYIPFDTNVVRDERDRLGNKLLGKKPASLKYGEFTQEVVTYDDNA